MESKDQLIKTIREWVKIDNEIRALQNEQNLRKKEKKNISSALMGVMKSNEIDCFELNDGGQLIYNKKNVKKPITKKVLLNILSKYYNGDSSKASELNAFILENREEIIKESLVRIVKET
jgi:hypothetical protein